MRRCESRKNTKGRWHSIAPGEEWATTRREVTESRIIHWYEPHWEFWLSSWSHKTCTDRKIQGRKILRSPRSRTPGASPICSQALRWQPTTQDASEPTRKRLIHRAWNMTGFVCVIPLRYIPPRRVLLEAWSITKSERHQNLQHFDRILDSRTSEYETKCSHPLPPFILRMCSASLASSYPGICSINRLCEWRTSRNSLRQKSF